MPASPRLIAGLSSFASAGPIGCTSGLDALEFGVFEFGVLELGVLPDFLGVSGFFAMTGIWAESGGEKRAARAAARLKLSMLTLRWQQVSAGFSTSLAPLFA